MNRNVNGDADYRPPTSRHHGGEVATARRAALVQLVEVINSTADMRAVVREIAEEAARIGETGMASIYLYNDDAEFERSVSTGLSTSFARDLDKLARTEWAATDLVGANRPLAIRIVSRAPYPSPLHKLVASEGVVQIVSIPLICLDKLVGVIVLYHTSARDYGENELDLLHVVAGVGSLAVSHARLIETRKWEQKSQDQFLDVLSHELRTPLTSIMGFTQMIRRRFSTLRDTDPRLRDQLDLLWAQAQRLHRLLDTFVDMSNLERGEFTIEHEKANLVSVLNTAVEQSQAQARSQHELRWKAPDHSLWIHGDAKRLEHVFIHVITNAIRYSPADQPITVECKESSPDKGVVVSVTDQGPGIPSDLRKEIFKRFYPSDTRKAGGMGMGLYFSRAIVEAHGGHLTINPTPGGGTTVSVTLPRE